ncbi:MAG TPA: hypothetical protein VJ816_00420, partial [Gemmatimonadales bacterium]|nr:hypothetical protein [Gemmatimonadales bacterium]
MMVVVLALQALPCPQRAGAVADSGWQAYRANRIAVAAARFAVADSLCPGVPEIQIGLGFVALRRDRIEDAAARFSAALRADSLN